MAGSPMKSSNNGKKKAKNEKQSKSKKEWKIAKDRALLGTKAHESSDIPVQEDHGGSIAEEEEREHKSATLHAEPEGCDSHYKVHMLMNECVSDTCTRRNIVFTHMSQYVMALYSHTCMNTFWHCSS
jgi:hypothetical protein